MLGGNYGHGRVGEFIVVTRRLSRQLERMLLTDYKRLDDKFCREVNDYGRYGICMDLHELLENYWLAYSIGN